MLSLKQKQKKMDGHNMPQRGSWSCDHHYPFQECIFKLPHIKVLHLSHAGSSHNFFAL